MKLTNEKLVFEKEHKGFVVKAFWGDESDARVEITKDGQPYKAFLYPACRIFNIAAHFESMVDNTILRKSFHEDLIKAQEE